MGTKKTKQQLQKWVTLSAACGALNSAMFAYFFFFFCMDSLCKLAKRKMSNLFGDEEETSASHTAAQSLPSSIRSRRGYRYARDGAQLSRSQPLSGHFPILQKSFCVAKTPRVRSEVEKERSAVSQADDVGSGDCSSDSSLPRLHDEHNCSGKSIEST